MSVPDHPVPAPIPVPRRLAFLTTTPMSIAGGSGTYVGIRQLRASLCDRGIRVALCTPRGTWRAYTAQRLFFNLAVARSLRAGEYDWVVGFDLDGFHYGRAPAAPYVASIKGVIADERRNERGVVRAMLGLQAALERVAVRRAHAVVATSDYSRRRIVEAYGIPVGKVVVVPEPIDLDAWGKAPDVERADPPAILTVAHLYPRKNLGVLLRAYRLLADAGVPFQAWVVGEGPCRAAWEAECAALRLDATVSFLGTVGWRELRARYAAAALFCLPSKQEGFGIVFAEAMACGLPVVAGNVAAIPETVLDGVTGLLVDPRDAEALAAGLMRLLRSPVARAELGAAGRARAAAFRSDVVAGLFLERVAAGLARAGGPTCG